METIEPTIPEFYKNKNIFITGGTGFIGKALIEKFLRSCPDIGNIYVLIRPKRGKSVEERMQSFVREQIFQRVQHEQPNLKLNKKIRPLAGDCKLSNLGLSPEDRDILLENVNIIFHGGASVRFNDPLQEATLINVRGTREICQLALDAKKLIAFIQISTAFVNIGLHEVQEKFYPRKMDWRKLIEIAENYDSFILNVLSDKILNGMPNTYTFTKNVGENVVFDMLNEKVLCEIFRPSIVWCAMSDEPVKGWLDTGNLNGPTAIFVGCGTGLLQSVFTNPKLKSDYIPIDVCVKSLIVSTWDMAVRDSQCKTILPVEILHCTAYKTESLRLTTEMFCKIFSVFIKKMPFNNMIMIPICHFTANWYIWYIRTIITMILPAILIDAALKISGKKLRLLKLQSKVYLAQMALKHFMFTNFEFVNNNLLQLRRRIKQNDKNEFDYEFQNIDSETYIVNALIGTRRYVLDMPDCTIENAKKRYKKIERITQFMKFSFLIIVCYVLYEYLLLS